MSYVQIQSTLTVLIDACLLLVPVLFVAHVVCKFGPKEAIISDAAEVEVAEVSESIAEVEVAEVSESIAEVEVAEVPESIAEVEVAEVPESIAEVEVAGVKEQVMSEETLMNMLDRVSEEVMHSIHAWDEGSDLVNTIISVEEARARLKEGEDLVAIVELFGHREFFKVQKLGRKYVYLLDAEGKACRLCITGVEFWQA